MLVRFSAIQNPALQRESLLNRCEFLLRPEFALGGSLSLDSHTESVRANNETDPPQPRVVTVVLLSVQGIFKFDRTLDPVDRLEPTTNEVPGLGTHDNALRLHALLLILTHQFTDPRKE